MTQNQKPGEDDREDREGQGGQQKPKPGQGGEQKPGQGQPGQR